MPLIVYLILALLLAILTYFLVVKFIKEKFILIPKAVPLSLIIASTIVASISYLSPFAFFTFLSLAIFLGLCVSFWPWVYTSVRSWAYFITVTPITLLVLFLSPLKNNIQTLPVVSLVVVYVIVGTLLLIVKLLSSSIINKKNKANS